MNLLLIIVGMIFLICIVVGYVKGILRIGVSLLATIASIVLVMFITPYVSDALQKFTPINDMVESKCASLFTPYITPEVLQASDLTGTSLEDKNADELAEIDWENTSISMSDVSKILGEIAKDEQIKAIETSGLPSFLQSALLSNNNSEIYKKLGITSFPEYIVAYISKIILNVLGFLIAFILVTIIVRALIVAVDIISDLPVFGLVTRFAGAALGAVAALIIVWVLFMIITLGYSTNWGQACFQMIGESRVLTAIYDMNYILKLLMTFLS